VVSSVASCWPVRVLTCQLVAAPGVLEDPDFEVRLLKIHTVKIYEKSVKVRSAWLYPMESLECQKKIRIFGKGQ